MVWCSLKGGGGGGGGQEKQTQSGSKMEACSENITAQVSSVGVKCGTLHSRVIGVQLLLEGL